MSHLFHRRTLAVFALLALTVTATAQTLPINTTDLGQSHPHAADMSANPDFHVYLFQRDGIEYVQVNDEQGTVRAAVAVSNGTVIVLPIGIDSERISIAQQIQQNPVNGQTVYQDSQIRIAMLPQQNGTSWYVLAATGTPRGGHLLSNTCSVVDCGNPAAPTATPIANAMIQSATATN